MRTGGLIDACFLLGDDEQVQAAFAQLKGLMGRSCGGRYPLVAQLAAARVARDVAACEEVVAEFDRLVALEPDSFRGTGGMNSYDWLEVALVTRSEIAGEVSPRLFEL